MKIPWLKIARVVAEVAWDALTGKLERRAVGLTHVESELQSRYAREAGKHGVVYGKPAAVTPQGRPTHRH